MAPIDSSAMLAGYLTPVMAVRILEVLGGAPQDLYHPELLAEP